MDNDRPKFSATAVSTLRVGDHACWLFQASDEFRLGIEQFVRDGLAARERVVLLCSSEMCAMMQELVADLKIDSDDVEIADLEEVILPSRELNPDEFLERLRDVREEALHEACDGVRIALDMSWTVGNRASLHQVARLCMRLDVLLSEGQMRMLSFFDRRVFSATRLLDLLPCYPFVVLTDQIRENIYYAAAEKRLQRKRHDALLDHVLEHLEGHDAGDPSGLNPLDAESALVMLKSILDSMGDGVIVTDETGKMLLANKAVASIIGYGSSKLSLNERVRKFGNFLPDRKTPYPVEDLPIARAMRGESTDNVEIYIKNDRRPNGVWVSVNGRPLRSPQGVLRGGIVMLRDITRQKEDEDVRNELEIRISQTQKLESLGLLAGGIAHDFNNLLMGILGNAGLALLEAEGNAGLTSRLSDIKTTATRLSELTNQLLDYSGQGSFVKESVNLADLVQEMQDLLRPVISKRAKVVCESSDQEPTVQADPTQIRQILMNLITNASDALGNDPGEITIRTGRMHADREYLDQGLLHEYAEVGEYSYCEVQDTGCGMAPEVLKRIFDPFFTTKVQGRGLGLAAVLGLVRRHRGTLIVQTEEGQGTTFRVMFPASNLKPSKGTIRVVEHVPATVLVVDDELVVRNIAKEMLERSGFKVLTAESGREGIDIFRANVKDIDAVLLDMTMPDMDGAQVFRELKAVRPTARIILSSGYSEAGTTDSFPTDGLSGYLQKPYAPEVLVGKVRQVISTAAAVKDAAIKETVPR